jgi:hypothetical protein
MRVDVHAHYYHSTYVDRLARNGADTRPAASAPGAAVTFDQRVGLLDSAGIRVQVLSVRALQPPGRRSAPIGWSWARIFPTWPANDSTGV